jgi:hypothetical integral membrane protein (TIGR02206 family)
MWPMSFRLFGPDHLAALVLTAFLAATLVRVVRRDPRGRAAKGVRMALVVLLLSATATFLVYEGTQRSLSVWDFMPLHLCDFLILVAAYALLSLRPAACELLYFWSGGALLAMLTPDLGPGFPQVYFLVFFGLHGAVVASAAVVVFGFGRRPRPSAPWRVLGLTVAYAAAVGAVDWAFGVNFLYLCRKPDTPTLLDGMGPWPVYLATATALALLLFHALALPFRAGARRL